MLAAMRRASSCDGSHIAQEAGQVKVAPDPGKGQLTGATGRGLGTLHSPAAPRIIFFHIDIAGNTGREAADFGYRDSSAFNRSRSSTCSFSVALNVANRACALVVLWASLLNSKMT